MTSESLTWHELRYVEFKQTQKNEKDTCDYDVYRKTLQDAIYYEHWDILKLIESELSGRLFSIYNCLEHAIKYNKPTIFTWLLPFIPTDPRMNDNSYAKDLHYTAAYSNQFQFLKLLMDRGIPLDYHDVRICYQFAGHGNLEALQWCRSQGCSWNEDTCNAAAKHGHLHILEWCQRCTPPCTLSVLACSNAAKSGHLHILKWLKDNGKPWNPTVIFCEAGTNGHMHIVKWIVSHCGRMHAAGWTIDWNDEDGHVQECEYLESFLPRIHTNYNASLWYQTYSLRGLWITQIDQSLATIVRCRDLETLIKNYI